MLMVDIPNPTQAKLALVPLHQGCLSFILFLYNIS